MSSAVRVRAATEVDLPELLRLDRLAFGEHAYSPSTARQLLDLFAGLVLLAQPAPSAAEDGACGFAYGALAAGAPAGWILALGVEPERQRCGVGSALTAAMLERLEARGAERVRLTVSPEALAARAFYERHQFRAVEHFADYLGPGRHRLVLERASFTR